MKGKFLLVILVAIAYMLTICNSCKPKNKNYQPIYSADTSPKKILLFGVPTQSYYEIHDLFVRYLNERLNGVQIQTVANSSFLGYMDKLHNRDFDLTIVNGGTALQSLQDGYAIICHAVDEQGYAGAILVNKDSSINSLSDLKGKTVATPGYPALAGHMLQMVYLSKKGINVNSDLKLMKLESFESVFLNLYLGKCAAGFSTTNSFTRFLKRRPEIAAKVAVMWVTPAITGNAFLIRNSIDEGTAYQLKQLLLSMHSSEEGRRALAKIGYLKFVTADSNSYQPVKDFLKEYNALIVDSKQ